MFLRNRRIALESCSVTGRQKRTVSAMIRGSAKLIAHLMPSAMPLDERSAR